MKHYSVMKQFTVLMIMLTAIFVFAPAHVRAGIVAPSGDSRSNYRNIVAELERTGEVTLQSGKTYTLQTTIYPENGWTINAEGATIICSKNPFTNNITATNYNSLNGFTINGGTWITDQSKGLSNSLMKFAHAQNLKFQNMKIRATNVEGHTLELVACKNVEIRNCNISEIGTPKKTSVEEAIQIDVATPTTAPFLAGQPKFCNGAGCQNITVDKCTVSGGRAVCANFLNSSKSSDKKYMKSANMHKNITVTKCTLTGLSSEGLALFNTMNAVVKNNKITSKSKRTSDSHSVGCHLALFYKATAKQTKASKVTITGNTVYGGRQGLNIDGHGMGKYGTVTVKKNKFYSKKGVKSAFNYGYVTKMKQSGNKLKKW